MCLLIQRYSWSYCSDVRCIGCRGYWFSCATTGIRQDNPGTTLPSERLWGALLDVEEIIMFWHQGRPEMASACTNSLSSAAECLRGSYPNSQGCIQVQRLQAVGKTWEDPRKIWEKCSSHTKHSQGSMEITSSKLPQTARTQDHRKGTRRWRYKKVLTQSLLQKKIQSRNEYKKAQVQSHNEYKKAQIQSHNEYEKTQNQAESQWACFAGSQACPLHLFQTLGQLVQLFLPLSSQVTKTEYCFLLLLC